MASDAPHVIWLEQASRNDVARVGGKNASLGEMIRTLSAKGVRVPPRLRDDRRGLLALRRCTTSSAPRITSLLADLEAAQADARRGRRSDPQRLPARRMAGRHRRGDRQRLPRALPSGAAREPLDVAVRSSATAEDLPEASFAGQQETYLNVRGDDGAARCLPALLRLALHRPGDQLPRRPRASTTCKVALSIGVQRMVRSDLGGSGVMFSIDTETGFDEVVLINAAWGLGENVVQGAVDPDEYQVFKPLLGDPALMPIVEKKLGGKAQQDDLRERRRRPTDATCRPRSASAPAFVLSDAGDPAARPLGGRHRAALRPPDGHGMGEGRRDRRALHRPGAAGDGAVARQAPALLKSYRDRSEGQAAARRPRHRRGGRRRPGLRDRERRATSSASSTARCWSTETTDPDWVPIMKRAAAIVTDHGGRTSHAAIVSRELGLPAIVGTGNATARAPRRAGGHGLLRRGRRGLRLRGHRRLRGERRSTSTTCPTTAHRGDAEPRQSGGGVPLVAAAGRRRRPGADGVRRQQPHQASIRWRCVHFDTLEGRGGQARDRRADARLCRQDANTSSTGWRAASRGSPRRSTRSRSSCA